METLVVDAANVVGSVPDGWWRDRAGAAARLHARLVAAGLPFGEVILVVEGQARAGVPEGEQSGVIAVHATGSGDDEIVAVCRTLAEEGRAVTLVSADRGLVARTAPFGVGVWSPRMLRQSLGWAV